MSLTPAELQDRFRGAFVGLAVGDALGFPLSGVPPRSLSRLTLGEELAAHPRGRFAKGQFSDDTQLMMAAAHSVSREARVDGRSWAAHLVAAWEEGVLLTPPPGLAAAVDRLVRGVPWMSAGAAEGVRDASATSRGLVVGLFTADARLRLPHDASVLTVVTHKDPLCAAAAAAYARAVSLALEDAPRSPVAFCHEVALAAAAHHAGLAEEVRHLPRALSWEPERALELLVRVGVPTSELPADGGLPAHATPSLLCALYAALRAPHDFRAAMAVVLRAGGALDSAAALTGGLMGAHLGLEAIPPRLRKGVLYAAELIAAADLLLAARERARAALSIAAVAPTSRGRH